MPVDPAQLDDLFAAALAEPDAVTRTVFLDQACAGNPELRERLEALLVAHEAAGSFLHLPADESTTHFVPLSEYPGTTIGRYKLLEQIGQGGFGVVFMAEQEQPVRRRVALKVIKLGMDTNQVVARFEAERQALAMMDHPNIAKVFDAGATDAGRPYFVMELVRGMPITEYCDQARLTTNERLALFQSVCAAVQHAHQKGIIHRDLKPSNVLVTLHDDKAVPKVIDFGVAKATQARLTERTLFTEFRQMVGTPSYMSPEQASMSGLDVDTRSDIYSLGVLLYELLTGSTPFEQKRLREAALDELLRIIREEEPPKPSTKLSSSETLPSIAANRHTEPDRLTKEVRGELDWIVMKSLDKDRKRRYQSASALAEELQRYLTDQPVGACPPSVTYRFRKFVRRNKVALLTTAIVSAALIVGAFASMWQAVRASRAEARAEKAAAATVRFYDSILQEIRLTGEVRSQGYGEVVRKLVDEARDLPIARVDRDELRRQLVLSMGDFVAYPPVVIRPKGGKVTSICISSDGREIFAGQSNGHLSVYRVATDQPFRELEPFASEVRSIALSADGNRLLAADVTREVRVWRRFGDRWNLKQTIRLYPKKSITRDPFSVVFSSDGELFAYQNGTVIETWNVATETKLSELATAPDWTMRNAAFDMSKRRVVGGYTNDKTDTVGWALWDLATGERLHEVTMPNLGYAFPNAIDVARDGGHLAIGFDEALMVYDMANFQQTGKFPVDTATAVAFSPTSPYLAAVDIRGWITLWNSLTNRQLVILRQPGNSTSLSDILFSADGSHLAASNADSIFVWDLTRADEKTVLAGHELGIPCAAFHPDGRLLATGGKDNEVRIWQLSTGKMIQLFNLGAEIQALAFSTDGQHLAVGCRSRTDVTQLRVFDTRSYEKIYEAYVGDINSLSLASGIDGSYLAACGRGRVRLWKVPDNRPFHLERVVELDRSRCLATILDKAARWMVWVQNDSQLQAWDISTGGERLLHAPSMLQGWHGVAFLPDGESIIYVTERGVAEIWNVKEDCHVDSFGEPGTFNVPHIALSPNGDWFAGLTQPDTVSIWHLPTRERVTLRPDVRPVMSLAWDPSSQHLAVGQSDGGLVVWHLPRIQEKLAEAGLPWQDND